MLSRLNIYFRMNICSSWWGGCWQMVTKLLTSYPSISSARVSICLFHITTSFKDPFHQFNFLFFVYNLSLNVLRPSFSGFIIAIIHLIPHGNSTALLLKTSGFTNCQSLQEQCSHRILGGGGGGGEIKKF